VKVLYFSVDPINRVWVVAKTYIDKVELNHVMSAFGVGQILKSNDPAYKPGDIVFGMLQWSTYMVTTQKKSQFYKLPKIYPYPHHFLGVLGLNGWTAYFGLKKIGNVKEGETVVVSTAAGATGELVCGLAKIWKCRVIGIAGSQEKCKYVTDVLKADGCINYITTKSLHTELKELCPKGIDVYFDNVGEAILDTVLGLINDRARIILCGAMSTYNSFEERRGIANYSRLIMRRGKMEGLMTFIYANEFADASKEILGYMQDGSLQYRETIVEGVENAPKALKTLFDRKNIGRVMIKVSNMEENSKL